MNRALKIILPATGIAVAATAYLIAPGRHTAEQDKPFIGRNFAHRGLHKFDKSVPENSLSAFRAAAEAGYGIELDVHITADDELVVFHDDTLARMCGVDEPVEEQTLEQLQTRSLLHTQETLPTLGQALAVIDGRVPLIIELKRGGQNQRLCQLTLAHIEQYSGEVCVESFDPFILRWFRKHAPQILRGQLTCSMDKFGQNTNPFAAFLVSRGLTNFLGRPQFIAHDVGKKSLLIKLTEAMGALKFCWTSRDWRHEEANDAVIFEHYRPQPVYRSRPRIERKPCPLKQILQDWIRRLKPAAVDEAAE